MSALLQPVLQNAICTITQEVMKDPHALPCGHSFEKEAIEGWINANQNAHGRSRCPECRTRFTHIARNFTAKNMLDAIPDSTRLIASMALSAKRESMRIDRQLSEGETDQAIKIFDACRRGDMDLLDKHISRDSLVRAKREFPIGKIGWTPFHEAAFQGHLNILDRLYEVCPELLFVTREDGYSALYAAAEGGNKNALEWIHGKDHTLINESSLKGKYTLLHAATQGGDEESIRFLVETKPTLLNLRAQEHPLGDEKTKGLLAALQGLDLKELDLRKNQLTEKIADSLSLCLGTLSTELLLGGNPLGPIFFEKILSSLRVSDVEKINLKHTSLTDDGASIAARLIQQTGALKELGLEQNQITDEGAKQLAEALKANRSLTTLWLNDNQITDTGARYFFEALQQRTMPLKLNLLGNSIGEATQQMLRTIRNHTVTV
ncbi:ankyrin repeat domain-containing protein [Candidatus Neptunichlamydia sp. REUL1]|uniref:ankyrin repeat domain-containing protein n=1 Tax=Candidatus Neptunichlamydia sp. REUL1 TaxID=3064277 RepID=UPI00292DDCC4|nr:ankyrin repeat domain-containing protein [Candidatus Neptunochlamydia sp. REUL1]